MIGNSLLSAIGGHSNI